MDRMDLPRTQPSRTQSQLQYDNARSQATAALSSDSGQMFINAAISASRREGHEGTVSFIPVTIISFANNACIAHGLRSGNDALVSLGQALIHAAQGNEPQDETVSAYYDVLGDLIFLYTSQ